MDHAPSLESVAQAFRLWRQTRPRKGRTPAPLRAQAVALLAHHSRCQVSWALGIAATTLSNWRKHAPAPQGRASSVNPFVELPLTPSAQPLPEPAAITVTRSAAAQSAVGGLVRVHQPPPYHGPDSRL